MTEKHIDSWNELVKKFENNNGKGYYDVIEIMKIASVYRNDGDYEKSENTLKYGLSLHQDNLGLLRELIICHIAAGEYEEAQTLYDTKNLDRETRLLFEYGANLDKEGGAQEATKSLETIVNEPNIGYETILAAAWLMCTLDDSENCTDKIIKRFCHFDTDDHAIKRCLCALLKNAYKYDKTVEITRSVLDQDPYNEYFWTVQAFCYLEMGNMQETEETLGFALAVAPDSLDINIVQARFLLKSGKKDEAIELFTNTLDACEDDADLAFNISCYGIDFTEDTQTAKKLIYRFAEIGLPYYPVLLGLCTQFYSRTQDFEIYSEIFDWLYANDTETQKLSSMYIKRLLSKLPADLFDVIPDSEKSHTPTAYLHRGYWYEQNKEWDKCVENYEQFLKLVPNDTFVGVSLSTAYAKNGDYQKGAATIGNIAEDDKMKDILSQAMIPVEDVLKAIGLDLKDIKRKRK